jgi:APA family basic amino acid/polyamine antiporter
VLLGVALGDQSAALAIGVVGYLTAVVPSLQGVSPALLALGMIWLFVAICLFGRARAAACRS